MAGAIVNKFWEVFGMNQAEDEDYENEYDNEEIEDEQEEPEERTPWGDAEARDARR